MNKNTARFLLLLLCAGLLALSALIVWWLPILLVAIGLFYWLLAYLINKAF